MSKQKKASKKDVEMETPSVSQEPVVQPEVKVEPETPEPEEKQEELVPDETPINVESEPLVMTEMDIRLQKERALRKR